MMTPAMMTGARQGTMSGLRRIVAAAMARDLCAFVVPGLDVARAHGLNPAANNLHLAATPRHANVLLIVGKLPDGLADAAAVAYAQMPRPRAILALGAGDIAPQLRGLPAADVTGELSQAGLAAALRNLRAVFAGGAFAPEVTAFEAPVLQIRIEYTCPMHPEVVSDEPGSCPKCGMTLVPKETSASGHAGHAAPEGHAAHGGPAKEATKQSQMPAMPASGHAHSHDEHGHGEHAAAPAQYTCPMHPEVVSDEPGSCPKCGMTLVPVDDTKSGTHGHGAHGHGAHGHSEHGHSEHGHSEHGHSEHGHGEHAAAPAQYTCPMHPEVVSDAPGSCPKCGMTLVPVDAAKGGTHGHGEHGHGEHGHGEHAAAPAQYTCPMHPEVVSDAPGSCPKCGMTLVPVDHTKDGTHGHGAHGHGEHGHGEHGHGEHAAAPAQYTCPMHPEVVSDTPGSCPKCGMTLVPVDDTKTGTHGHGGQGGDTHGGHGGMDHSMHGGHGGETVAGIEPHFMSMVGLTRDMPASPDGLRMDWIDVPFGPFFPGLPAGLDLNLTLDGDTVVATRARSLLGAGSVLADLADPQNLGDRLAALVPLSPVAMRELACRALETAAGGEVASDVAAARAAAVERERIISHLGWLAGFAGQTGMVWLERRAAALQLALRDLPADKMARRGRSVRALLRRVRATPLMKAKLAGIGRLDGEASVGGPVARASARQDDARAGDPVYAALGFAIVTGTGGDALARLRQRCDEMAQSLDLIAGAGAIAIPASPDIGAVSGQGTAEIETPRGPARLDLTLKAGRITGVRITTPFAAQIGLIDGLAAQAELADALTAIGSLDLDPWEVAQ